MSFHWQWDTTTTTTTTTRTTTTTTPASCRSPRSVPARFHCGRCSCCGHFCGLRFRAGNQTGVEWVGGEGCNYIQGVLCYNPEQFGSARPSIDSGWDVPPTAPPTCPPAICHIFSRREAFRWGKKNNNEKVRFGAVRLKTFMCLRKKTEQKK